jgi:hypothetical protein
MNNNSNIVLSVVFGIIISCIIFYVFVYEIIYRGPNSNDIRNNIYFVNGKLYKLTPVIYVCPNMINNKTIK